MQKKLIALAIAGLASSAAFAQSNVSVYGVVDVYAATSGATGTSTRTSVNSGGLSTSRIGFKGVEDLGNGLKALFTLEYALSVDADQGATSSFKDGNGNTITASNGSGIGAARQQFVGLTGGFGTAVAGRLQTAGYDFAAATNALHGTAINALDRVNPTALINSTSRANNAVAYISPSFGGVTIAVNHARLTENAVAVASSDSFANLVSATYVNGPLTVAAVADSVVAQTNPLTGTPSAAAGKGTTGTKEWGLGGSYDFGVATLKASYLRTKSDAVAATADKNNKVWQISGIIPVSAVGKVVLGYAKNTIDTTAAADNGKAASIAYLHSLSKRTTLYTGYQNVRNESAGNSWGNALATPTALGGSSRIFVAGVNHSF